LPEIWHSPYPAPSVWVFLLRYVPDADVMYSIVGLVPNRRDLLRSFAPAAATLLVFLLAFGLVGGWILAGCMLAPLTRITDAARRAAEGSLSHRIGLEGRQDEFRGLSDAFDTLLARLEAQIAEQQRFAANASHELRTPLTTNLMHNAIVHHLPEQGSVWVTTAARPEAALLTVENSGAPVSPQVVSTFTEPFQRGSERRRTDHRGVGLGLAIVKSITRAHGATLTLTPRPAGGLRVTVHLSATPPHRST